MNTTYLIIGAVVVLLLLVVLLVVLGNQRKKAKTISFSKDNEKTKELTQQEKSGNYTAQSGFNFAPAKQKQELLPNQQLAETTPIQAQQAPQVKDPVQPVAPSGPAAPAEPAHQPQPVEPEPMTLRKVEREDKSDEVEAVAEVEPVHTEPAAASLMPEEDVEEAVDKPAEADIAAEAEEAAVAASATAEGAEAALAQTPAPDTEPVPAPQPLDEIEPAAGRLGKLRGKLAKSNNFLGQSVLGMLSAGDLDEDAWEEIEDQLIMADLGANTSVKAVEMLREKIAERGVSSEAEAKAMLRETLIEIGRPELDRSIKAMPYEGKPAVVLVVGVNGTGKTTTTGKLARVLVSMGHKVLLGAADTFRAAAADQLETWGRRVGAETVRGAEGADPASVAFDAVAKGVETQADVVLIDTAGRLHTSVGLMDQLGKVKRVVEKKAKVDEVLLVLDATVGQNGLIQARTFRDVVDITGVVLTKLDGTAKGGIVFQVQEELGVPVKLVGLGEGADHLAPFEVESFVDALLA
ncbi:signal recognition particle-docking protein FtsY [Corynebacterium epidermidicanis]|nr:signal recognition particle-docking protein FtsY [Corynebacterium epidermidicanis]